MFATDLKAAYLEAFSQHGIKAHVDDICLYHPGLRRLLSSAAHLELFFICDVQVQRNVQNSRGLVSRVTHTVVYQWLHEDTPRTMKSISLYIDKPVRTSIARACKQ